MARRKNAAPTLDLTAIVPPTPVDAAELVDGNYRDYALYVIGDRAVPSVADGLKPVARRILWEMFEGQRATPDRPHVKCARISGAVIGRWHPHGDGAAYEALVRLAQPYSQRAPLIDFHGNYGSPDFAAASSRYTEARLADLGMVLLDEVRDGTVAMVPNYDETETEPAVLPSPVPNLLINGSYGIAVGIASFIPPHNPLEVVAAARHLIARPKATVDELLEIVTGPDFPDAAVVVNGDELNDIYRSGEGTVRVRGTWEIDEGKRGERIVITSLPYSDGSTASSKTFIEKVVAGLGEGTISGIEDIVNETADDKLRIVIELARGITASQVVPMLLRPGVGLQTSNSVRLNALDADGNPQRYNIRTILEAWVAHRVACITSRSLRRIDVATDRLHVLTGLLAVLLDIDRAIAIIRGADDVAEARAGLMEAFEIDEVQANYVLDLTLRRLTRLARIEVDKESAALQAELNRLTKLLASPTRLRRQVGVEMDAAAKRLGWTDDAERWQRTTEITVESPVTPTVAVLDEPVEIVVATDGYTQAFRNGSRAKEIKDHQEMLRVSTSTATQLVVIGSSGQMHRSLAASFSGDRATPIQNVVAVDPAERLLWFGQSDDLPSDVLLVTSSGTIKRLAGDDLTGGDRKGGVSLIKLDAGERVVAMLPFDDATPLLIATAGGQGIRFVPTDVRPMGRNAAGVRGIKLADGDSVIGAGAAPDGAEVFVGHEKGAAKRVDAAEFPVQGRAGKGVRLSVPGRHGKVSALFLLDDDPRFTAVTTDGNVVDVNRQAVTAATRDAGPAKVRSFGSVIAFRLDRTESGAD
ncbi:DNA gyrase/topoisomerase IV subunit A [Desertimonas flava]|uniref:DNA gyrase/topoisomerase IV subunit A n=1 Tax=Desertimonas flava TaxID=2064846 RepID=UPI000E347C48|nr:DNA topoisomerase (ATP-hydrolyzing) subunit A [Desertimonas flava]